MAVKRTRPRGFIYGYTPTVDSMMLINQVQTILDDERDYLPLTLRQIFYMMVSRYNFDKTEKAYQRLCEIMNKARRGQLVSMTAIRDDGLTRLGGGEGYESEDEWWDITRNSASYFTLNRQMDQPVKLFVWCEAGGMAPQLRDAVSEWHIPVLSSGGFDSVTTKHNMALQLSEASPCLILHLGDHDPSGVHMYRSLDEDLQAFLAHFGGDVELERLAVTPHQVATMNLPTAPPKRTDNRSFVGETTQCEAIPPRELRRIVREAVEQRIDHDALQETLEQEQAIRTRLVAHMENI